MNVIGFDLGASSGRAMEGQFDGGRITLNELHRFPNNPVEVNGTLHWDILRLFHEIKQGLNKAADRNIAGISIDTWGVDFGLLDAAGRLMENPVHYRDKRTDGMEEAVCAKMPAMEIYERTGIDFMFFNTLLQLHYLTLNRADLLERTDTLLYTPDLLKYFLTGEKGNEYTMASTSQLVSASTRQYDQELLKVMGIPAHIFPSIVDPCTVTGEVFPSLLEELNIKGRVPFISTASHDTAAAVVAVPADGEDHVYISCGTWSLVGMESGKPIINSNEPDFFLKNIGGVGNMFLPQKNVMGLWILQECRRQWAMEGQEFSFAELAEMAQSAPLFMSFIDPDDMLFAHPCDMPENINAYCRNTRQTTPEGMGETVSCVLQSLAMKYRYMIERMEATCGKRFDTIHIVGGGTQNKLLCQMTANASNKRVVAGPVEATALGNITMQLKALGELGSVADARQVIRNSFDVKEYLPENHDQWNNGYGKFLRVCGLE